MFTGITRGLFEVVRVEREGDLLRYAVDLGEMGASAELGASVAIDGCCQTVVANESGVLTFEAIQETLRLTTLGELDAGAQVSVERSARVGDEIGGHEVSGHIRGTGEIVSRRHEGHELDVEIAVPREWMAYVLPKGFIAVDGSSMTVGETTKGPERGSFFIHLIPETIRLTKLGSKEVGAKVNVELDPKTVAIVDTVERVLAERGL